MRKLILLVGACLASLMLYGIVFSVVKRPLTLDDLTAQMNLKLDAAGRVSAPKILVFAGSNGRYSHRCSELAAVLNRPCVNASIASGIGIDFQLGQYAPLLNVGDIVYMPLEYDQYAASEANMHHGIQNAVILRNRPDYLWSLPVKRIAETYGAFDLPFLIRGSVEMALVRGGFKRRTGLDTLTPEGDERGHSTEKAKAYEAYLRQAPAPRTSVPDHSYALVLLREFLDNAKRRGVIVVGGLPTVPESTEISTEDVARIRALFQSAGHPFVVTPTLSRYPIDCFYDGPYHLQETCQMRHSKLIGELIARELALASNQP